MNTALRREQVRRYLGSDVMYLLGVANGAYFLRFVERALPRGECAGFRVLLYNGL